jgi:hypothetical protein
MESSSRAETIYAGSTLDLSRAAGYLSPGRQLESRPLGLGVGVTMQSSFLKVPLSFPDRLGSYPHPCGLYSIAFDLLC